MSLPRPIACCLIALSLASVAEVRAQSGDFGTDRLYHVEVVIFAQTQTSRSEEDLFHGVENPRHEPLPRRFRLPGLEIQTLAGFTPRLAREPVIGDAAIAADEPEPDGTGPLTPEPEAPADALELFEMRPDARAAVRFDGALPEAFRVLGRGELQLDDVRADLSRWREFRVLGHAGWVQTGVDANETIPVDLRLLGITNPSGTIRVWLGRYLHVAVDLEYLDGRGSYWTVFPGTGLAPLENASRYHHVFEPKERIRSGELTFIDHPLFGVIVLITPAPDPVETPDESAAGVPAA